MRLFRGSNAVERVPSTISNLVRVRVVAVLIAMLAMSMVSAFNIDSASASHGGAVVCDTGTGHCYEHVTKYSDLG